MCFFVRRNGPDARTTRGLVNDSEACCSVVSCLALPPLPLVYDFGMPGHL